MTTLAELDAKVERLEREREQARGEANNALAYLVKARGDCAKAENRVVSLDEQIDWCRHEVQELETAIARGRVTG